jgi:hypothetical protein
MKPVLAHQDDDGVVAMVAALQGIEHAAYLRVGAGGGGQVGANASSQLLMSSTISSRTLGCGGSLALVADGAPRRGAKAQWRQSTATYRIMVVSFNGERAMD